MPMTQTQLDRCRSADLLTCSPDALADLREIRIDTALPLPERMSAFVQQVGNPYLFRVDGLILKAVYPPDAGCKLCDAVASALSP